MKEQIECDLCDGLGEINIMDNDEGLIVLVDTKECPLCNGKGHLDIRKEK